MPATAAPAGVELTTVSQTIYTVPAGTRVVVEIVLTNIDGVNDATANVFWTDASAANAAKAIVFQAPVLKQNVQVTPRKALEAGDTITGLASANGDVVAAVNVLFSEAA